MAERRFLHLVIRTEVPNEHRDETNDRFLSFIEAYNLKKWRIIDSDFTVESRLWTRMSLVCDKDSTIPERLTTLEALFRLFAEYHKYDIEVSLSYPRGHS